MDRRKFLSTLIGGVAATAAVRTFPFRVFSFPEEIVTYHGVIEYAVPQSVAIWVSPLSGIGGPYRLVEKISLTEAKGRYGYDWSPGNLKTQQVKSNPHLYCAPCSWPTTTGLI